MRDNIVEFDEEINVDEEIEQVEQSFDPALPPAKQMTVAAAKSRIDALVAQGKFEAKHYFGDTLREGEFNGSITFNECGGHLEGLFFHDHKLADPFVYRGRTRLPDGEEAQVILFIDRRGVEKEIVLPFSVIAQGGAQLAAFLSKRGFYFPTHKGARDQFQRLLNVLAGDYLRCVVQPGWVPGELIFVLPDQVIGNTDKLAIVTDISGATNLKVANKGTPKGSRQLLRLCRGNSRLILAASTSLASSLLPFATQIMPTCIHMYGESSIGKSTANHVAGMIWGGQDGDLQGFGHSWNGTLNFHLKNAVSHSGMVYILDEMRAGTSVTQVAYALGSGQDRNRLDKSSNQVRGAKLQVFTLSTGEVTLDEMERLSSSKHQAFNGAEFRAPSLPADTGSGYGAFESIHGAAAAADFSDRIQSLARDHYGHVGPRFVEELINHIAEVGRPEFSSWLSDENARFVKSLKLPADADDAVKRLARTFGLIACAGRLACELQVFPLEALDVEAGVRQCFNDWLKARGGSRSRTSSTALAGLRDFINQYESRFVSLDNLDVKPAALAGYKDEKYYYLLPHAWKEVLALAPRARLSEELDRLDLIKRQGSSRGVRTDQIVKALAGGAKVRCYAIRSEIRELRDDGTLDDSVTQEADASQTDNIVRMERVKAMRKSLRGDAA